MKYFDQSLYNELVHYTEGETTWYVWHDPDGQAFFASQDYTDITARILGYTNVSQMAVSAKSQADATSKAQAIFDKERS